MKKLLVLALVLLTAFTAFAEVKITGEFTAQAINDFEPLGDWNPVLTPKYNTVTIKATDEAGINSVSGRLNFDPVMPYGLTAASDLVITKNVLDRWFITTDWGKALGLEGIGLKTTLGNQATWDKGYANLDGWEFENQVDYFFYPALAGGALFNATATVAGIDIIYSTDLHNMDSVMVGIASKMDTFAFEAYIDGSAGDIAKGNIMLGGEMDIDMLSVAAGFNYSLDGENPWSYGVGVAASLMEEALWVYAGIGGNDTDMLADAGAAVEYYMSDMLTLGAAGWFSIVDSEFSGADIYAGIAAGDATYTIGYAYANGATVEWNSPANADSGVFVKVNMKF
jgi:hypothetical protein